MPTFEYTALGAGGQERRGTVEADSAGDARRRLRQAQVHVTSLRTAPAAGGRPALSALRLRRRTDRRALAAATRQLSTLLRAGLPLVPALDALAEQLGEEPLGEVVASVRDAVNQGATMADALREHPDTFNELYVNMVRAGEAAGALQQVLLRLAEMTERRVSLTNRIRAALVYPVLVGIVAVAVVVFLLSAVVPSIARLFVQMERALPWPTVALIKVSGFTKAYLPALLIGAGLLLLAARAWVSTAAGRLAWDRMKLRMPLFGDLATKAAVCRFSRTLGVLLASGVPVMDAMAIVRRVVGNAAIAAALERASEAVRQGDSIAHALRQSEVLPPIVPHVIAAGEASGTVEQGLLQIAEAYEGEVETRAAALTSLLEPVLIIVMGAIIGFIVLAILLPIFDINRAIM
ncbi:MAG: type II secretion system F family protein [Candidatus Brocadiia bacterium]